MKLPRWLVELRPLNRQRKATERAIREAELAERKLIKAVDQVAIDHADPIAYLVHRAMDYKRSHRKPGDIG